MFSKLFTLNMLFNWHVVRFCSLSPFLAMSHLTHISLGAYWCGLFVLYIAASISLVSRFGRLFSFTYLFTFPSNVILSLQLKRLMTPRYFSLSRASASVISFSLITSSTHFLQVFLGLPRGALPGACTIPTFANGSSSLLLTTCPNHLFL